MRAVHFGTVLGLFVGYWFIRASIWVSLDLLSLPFSAIIATFDILGMLIIALIATHFTSIESYKAQLILAIKYLFPVSILVCFSLLL